MKKVMMILRRQAFGLAILACASADMSAFARTDSFMPVRAFWHEGRGGCVLDVTKPPFNAKGDGVHDDTAALVSAMKFVRDNLPPCTTPDGSVACAQVRDRNWQIYLPNGVYRVTDTVSQPWPALALTPGTGRCVRASSGGTRSADGRRTSRSTPSVRFPGKTRRIWKEGI